jgi:hypothetical protein
MLFSHVGAGPRQASLVTRGSLCKLLRLHGICSRARDDEIVLNNLFKTQVRTDSGAKVQVPC